MRRHFGKYGAMWTYLVENDQYELDMSFDEIESILGFHLPPSARRQSSFWLSHRGSVFGRAISEAGWRAGRVDLEQERVILRRDVAEVAIAVGRNVQDDTTYELQSTLLRNASWSPGGILTVRLVDGSRHRYLNVPRATFLGLLSAPSPGRFFLAEVKDRFEHERA